jgi:hypothetical protein
MDPRPQMLTSIFLSRAGAEAETSAEPRTSGRKCQSSGLSRTKLSLKPSGLGQDSQTRGLPRLPGTSRISTHCSIFIKL